MLKKLLFLCLLGIGLSEDFSDGPYGTGYFDIAGPFQLPDLNMSLNGDANLDEIVNIQDVILIVGQVLGSYNLDDEQFDQADTNNDKDGEGEECRGQYDSALSLSLSSRWGSGAGGGEA